jgi:hypothetical protein
MTKDEAKAWRARWQAVEERQARELRGTTYEERLRALAVLMSSASLFDFHQLDEEDERARARWARLQSLLSDRRWKNRSSA